MLCCNPTTVWSGGERKPSLSFLFCTLVMTFVLDALEFILCSISIGSHHGIGIHDNFVCSLDVLNIVLLFFYINLAPSDIVMFFWLFL